MKNTNNFCLVKKGTEFVPVDYDGTEQSVYVKAGETYECIYLVTDKSVHLKIVLAEKKAACSVKIVYLAAQENNMDIAVDIKHEAAETTSAQLIRGIVTDSAHVNFSGVIRIPFDSQKCVGQQNHRAIVLSDKAKVQATPELEIYADDVQCSHGSAIGPLDEKTLFYLQTRGIDKKTATKILLSAFVSDLVPEEKRSVVEEWMHEHL